MNINNQNNDKPKPYKIGLALSGGGARGYAHIGVLKALEEFHLIPDLIAGVSAGSIVGALYCTGMSPDDILKCFAGENFRDFTEITVPRVSLFNTDGFHDYLLHILGNTTFSQLKIPFVAIATDLDHGISKIFTEGRVADIVWASSSIPVIFPPVVLDGVNYVDGGVLRNFPVLPIRNQCEYIIGVNVNPLEMGPYKKNILGIAERSYLLMFRSNSVEDCHLCDMLIQPKEVAEYNIFDTKHMKEIVNAGYAATIEILKNYKKEGRLPTDIS
ncbi:MAG: patatin-like phospholipase family protein [Bacteroidales bacterium]